MADMKQTLGNIVKDILSSMDSDEVNTISDTAESLQVARCVRDSFHHIIAHMDIPSHFGYFELEAPSSPLVRPTVMHLPDNVLSVEWIKYNTEDIDDDQDQWSEIYYLNHKSFLEMSWGYNLLSDADVENQPLQSNDLAQNFAHWIRTDKAPHWYTIYNDVDVVFDSYDNDVDSALQASKTHCYGKVIPEFDLEDDYVPELPAELFPTLINEAKSQAFLELKETVNPIAERRLRRGWIRSQGLSKTKNKALTNFDKHPGYGRGYSNRFR